MPFVRASRLKYLEEQAEMLKLVFQMTPRQFEIHISLKHQREKFYKKLRADLWDTKDTPMAGTKSIREFLNG